MIINFFYLITIFTIIFFSKTIKKIKIKHIFILFIFFITLVTIENNLFYFNNAKYSGILLEILILTSCLKIFDESKEYENN